MMSLRTANRNQGHVGGGGGLVLPLTRPALAGLSPTTRKALHPRPSHFFPFDSPLRSLDRDCDAFARLLLMPAANAARKHDISWLHVAILLWLTEIKGSYRIVSYCLGDPDKNVFG